MHRAKQKHGKVQSTAFTWYPSLPDIQLLSMYEASGPIHPKSSNILQKCPKDIEWQKSVTVKPLFSHATSYSGAKA